MCQTGEQGCVVEGGRVLRYAFERQMHSAPGAQVVPVSDGLDSRLILAHLIEAGFRDQIVAVIYGTPWPRLRGSLRGITNQNRGSPNTMSSKECQLVHLKCLCS